MSFYLRNYGTIAGFGGPIPVAFTIDGGTGSRAQFAEAVPFESGSSLVSNNHTIERAGGRYTHYVWVRNETAVPNHFDLSGGGLY
jgi:hypothetical protein